MLEKVKVSFVLPAYRAEFFEKSINSILKQTFVDLELIVVDDCSPDDLKSIVDKFSDPRIQYFRNAKNLGSKNLIDNWNYALQYATGEFCVLASDDDMYKENYLQEMLELANKHPNCNLFHCRLARIDQNDNISAVSSLRAEYESAIDFLYARGIERRLQVAPEFFFRRSAIMHINGFVNFPLAWYSDDATWFSLANQGGVVYCPKILFYWRYSGNNISSRDDLILQKIDASHKYKKWISLFLKQIEIPISLEEKFVLQQCQKLIFSRIDSQVVYDIGTSKLSNIINICIKPYYAKNISVKMWIKIYNAFSKKVIKCLFRL